MKDRLRDLFIFSSGERKGIIVLVFVLIVICSFNMLLKLHHPAALQRKYPEWMKDTGAYEETGNMYYHEPDNNSTEAPVAQAALNGEPLSFIDPNSATLEELILSGFSLRVARTIVNYRKKGGKFRTPGDLKKIYGLTPEIFKSVEPAIRIDDPVSRPATLITLPATININTADSMQLERLPGIGPVLARRIIRYRALLGGYYSPEQIREVYGITDSLFLIIRERLEADTTRIKKLNLNTIEEKELARHPYTGKYVAAGIVRYRLHVSKILNFNELIINGLIPEDRYDRLKFYISL
jgi:DNA uptake protein ComE-like DNA-binding protein